MPPSRRLPIGAELLPNEGATFRVWAPKCKQVDVLLRDTPQTFPLQPDADGYHSGTIPGVSDGALYWYVIDGQKFPDPASRFQPDGPHGPSQIVDPTRFCWNDAHWPGCTLAGQVIYEMHIGTFTPGGTWATAIEKLPHLKETGITLLEVMPVAEFPGRFGWGYDGTYFFAPTRLYGSPDDFRRFVDAAHQVGLGVILDVVYNHFGPDGNYIGCYSDDYFTRKYDNEWGDALNFDGKNSGPVREFMAKNAAYWIDEFHLDGLRLDATQQIFDDSPEHILTVIGKEVRAAAKGKATLIVNENERQEARLIRPIEQKGCGLDAIWNDDFHHCARVAVTGHNEAYFTDYKGCAQELISALKWGFLYQGQRYQWQQARRGHYSLDLTPPQFIIFTQNHDQIANSGTGERLPQMTSIDQYKAITALMLLGPNTPMLFQGQEFAASAPFLFFADHKPELNVLIREGRLKFLSQFPSLATEEMKTVLPDPSSEETFRRCVLDWSEVEKHQELYHFHRDLLRLRRNEPTFCSQDRHKFDASVLSNDALVLRFFGEQFDDRLLFVNLGRDLIYDPAPEPLLAPPPDQEWEILWSSEDPAYGGRGTPPLESEELVWRIPAMAAVVLKPRPQDPDTAHKQRTPPKK